MSVAVKSQIRPADRADEEEARILHRNRIRSHTNPFWLYILPRRAAPRSIRLSPSYKDSWDDPAPSYRPPGPDASWHELNR